MPSETTRRPTSGSRHHCHPQTCQVPPRPEAHAPEGAGRGLSGRAAPLDFSPGQTGPRDASTSWLLRKRPRLGGLESDKLREAALQVGPSKVRPGPELGGLYVPVVAQ